MVVSRCEGDLSLNNLNELSDAVAEALSKHQGNLYLDGMTELSDAVAEALSKHQGNLYLRGLRVSELSDKAAEALSKHQGNLSLAGQIEFSDAAFRQVIETDQIGKFLVDGTHQNGLIESLKVFNIRDGKVGDEWGLSLETLGELAEKLQVTLTKNIILRHQKKVEL